MRSILFSLALLAAPGAQASVINFESFSDGDLVERVLSDDGLIGADVSAVGGANQARSFDTNIATYDSDLSGPFAKDGKDARTRNPGQVLIVQEEDGVADGIPDDNADGGVITFVFDTLVTFLAFDVFDDARVTVTADTGATATGEVFGDGKFRPFRFDKTATLLFADVKWLTFDFNGHSGAIDNLQFQTPDNIDPEPVPLPAGLPLLLGALGVLGLTRRRRG